MCCAGQSPRGPGRSWPWPVCGWSRRCAAPSPRPVRPAWRHGCAWPCRLPPAPPPSPASPCSRAPLGQRTAVMGDSGHQRLGPPGLRPTLLGCCCSLGTRLPHPAAWPWRSGHPWAPHCAAEPWYVGVGHRGSVSLHCRSLGTGDVGAAIRACLWHGGPVPVPQGAGVGAGGAGASPQWGGGFPAQGWVIFRCFEAPLGSELHISAYMKSQGRQRLSQQQRVPGKPWQVPCSGPSPSAH